MPPVLVSLLLTAVFTLSSTGCGPPTPELDELTGRIDAERAWGHLEAMVGLGPRPAGTEALEALREMLEAELESYGLKTRREAWEEQTPIGPIRFANVIAEFEGARPEGPWIAIGAHIDTKLKPAGFVGANDGASAPSVLLELARVLTEEAGQRELNYRFLFLDGEEALEDWNHTEYEDHTYGSRQHVRLLKAEPSSLASLKCFLLLDLVGDSKLQLMRESNSDARLLDIIFDAAKENGLGHLVNGPRMPIRDDHLPFIAAGIPSVDLIDFVYGPRNAYWHTLRDTKEHCSAKSLEQVGNIVLLALPAVEAWCLQRP